MSPLERLVITKQSICTFVLFVKNQKRDEFRLSFGSCYGVAVGVIELGVVGGGGGM